MGGGDDFLSTLRETQKLREGTFQSKQDSFIPLPLSPQSLQALVLIQARRKVAGLRGCGHTLVILVTTVASECVGLCEPERKGQRESRTGKKRRPASALSISECAYSAP